jgi:hypothetical protein
MTTPHQLRRVPRPEPGSAAAVARLFGPVTTPT